MNCAGVRTIHTIGHSTRTTEVFVDLLRAHDIHLILDVRRWPMSKRHPHFNRVALANALKGGGIEYLSRQDLGGFRKPAPDSLNTAWRVGSFRAYADFMLTVGFAQIMSEVEPIAAKERTAIMCAEALPWQCHRQLLADAFLVRGWQVMHIMDNACTAHKLPPFARPQGKSVSYPGLI
jgi:uncharacterized protein (DUF488 family)